MFCVDWVKFFVILSVSFVILSVSFVILSLSFVILSLSFVILSLSKDFLFAPARSPAIASLRQAQGKLKLSMTEPLTSLCFVLTG